MGGWEGGRRPNGSALGAETKLGGQVGLEFRIESAVEDAVSYKRTRGDGRVRLEGSCSACLSLVFLANARFVA